MCLAQGPQRSDAGEARTRSPSFSSQALYHWATALPLKMLMEEHCSHLYNISSPMNLWLRVMLYRLKCAVHVVSCCLTLMYKIP